MDMFNVINKIRSIGKYVLTVVLVMNAISISFASSNITQALSELCTISQTFLGGAIMIMILLAGATYAIGQVLGAETRARASVWATAMMTGAIVGALIYIITPALIGALLGSGDSGDPCSFQIGTA
ncbi:MAG: hypothetical protein ABH983_04100 [Candidatus Micrarchaeota archaeon]